MRRIAIVGSRTGIDREAVSLFVSRLPVHWIVVSGGARGVDSWAVEAAEERGMETIVIPAEWEKYGKSAGFRRNRQIVEESDSVVAFWDGESNDTYDTMKKAIKAERELLVFNGEGKPFIHAKPGEEALLTQPLTVLPPGSRA